MRLIDADALKEELAKLMPWAITDSSAEAFTNGLAAAIEAIDAALLYGRMIELNTPEE